jgi:hypothetical protein
MESRGEGESALCRASRRRHGAFGRLFFALVSACLAALCLSCSLGAVDDPAFSLTEGSYSSSQSVSISSQTAGATIKYTTDGSDPTTSSTASTYSSALTISSTTTLKAYAYKSFYSESGTTSATYTIAGSALLALREAPTEAMLVSTSSGYRLAFGIGPSLPYNAWTPWISSDGGAIWMSFVVEAGATYSISWDDSGQGSGYYSADIKVGAYESDKATRLSTWVADVDSGYSTPTTITSSTTKLVRLKVTPAAAGSFAVRVASSSSSTSGGSFAWYLDGAAISGATSYAYNVALASLPAGTHRFTCVGSRDGASFSESYAVTVK